MIEFKKFNFKLKRPSFDKSNITKSMAVTGLISILLMGVTIISVKQYFALQDSANALSASEAISKNLRKALADSISGRAEDKANFEKEKARIDDENILKIAAFAKQAASCDEIKKKLKIKH